LRTCQAGLKKNGKICILKRAAKRGLLYLCNMYAGRDNILKGGIEIDNVLAAR
jgi:hypothetical protein